MLTDWRLPILYLDECFACEACGEPICPICMVHRDECAHPGEGEGPQPGDIHPERAWVQ